MRRKGSISLYLAIIMLSIILLINVIAESARISAIQAKCKSVTYMAADSVMAGYARQVYDDYGILLVWNRNGIEDTMESYIQANIQMADVDTAGRDFLNAILEDVKANNQVHATDKGGEVFVRQVKKYLKYAGISKLINEVKSRSSEMKEEKSEDVTEDLSDDVSDEMSTVTTRIDNQVTNISNCTKLEEYQTELTKFTKDYKKKKYISSFEDLQEELEDLLRDIEDVLKLMEQYTKLKKELLQEHGYKKKIDDYVEHNETKLKKAREKIQSLIDIDSDVYFHGGKKETIDNMAAVNETNAYVIDQLSSLEIRKVSAKDKKNYSIYKTAKKLFNNGLLGLVIDDTSKLSDASISTNNLPSNNITEGESSLEDKAVMALYTYFYFGNYTKVKKGDVLQYGLEYLVAGGDSDKDNLSSVITRLIAIRHVPNIACLLKDGAKMSEIEVIAASIATVTGLPFLEPIAKGLLIEAWTLAESISDVRLLLKKEKISLVKSPANWRTSLANLLVKSDKGDGKGLDYIAYLEGLIMLTRRDNIVYRTMDLIQMNICKKYNSSFRMKDSVMEYSAKVQYGTAPLFAAIPWMVNMLGSEEGGYSFKIQVQKSFDK